MIDRFGEAIEYDMHSRFGLDLIEFFRVTDGRRHLSWRKLRNLIARLPAASAYWQALLDDPEAAERLARQPDPQGAATPSLEQFTPEVAVLHVIADRLGELAAGQVWAATSGKKVPKVTPLPRPVTGVHRARERLAQQEADALMDDFKAAQRRWAETRGGERDAGS